MKGRGLIFNRGTDAGLKGFRTYHTESDFEATWTLLW